VPKRMVEVIVVKMVDLDICHKHMGSIVTRVWIKLLIEIKKLRNYKFVDMNAMAFQNLLVLMTLKNC